MKAAVITLILILCGVGTFAACHGRQQNAGLPLVNASERANVVPWRLYSLCPPNRSNVPQLPRERIV